MSPISFSFSIVPPKYTWQSTSGTASGAGANFVPEIVKYATAKMMPIQELAAEVRQHAVEAFGAFFTQLGKMSKEEQEAFLKNAKEGLEEVGVTINANGASVYCSLPMDSFPPEAFTDMESFVAAARGTIGKQIDAALAGDDGLPRLSKFAWAEGGKVYQFDGTFTLNVNHSAERPAVNKDVAATTVPDGYHAYGGEHPAGQYTEDAKAYGDAVVAQIEGVTDPAAQAALLAALQTEGVDFGIVIAGFGGTSGSSFVYPNIAGAGNGTYTPAKYDKIVVPPEIKTLKEAAEYIRAEIISRSSNFSMSCGGKFDLPGALVGDNFVAKLPAYSYAEKPGPQQGGETPPPAGDPNGPVCTTKAQLKSYVEGLERDLSSVGDDAQIAQLDLQNMLQKQQQILQTLSNVSKVLFDTAMAIIRKIGG
jgi:hypothetical protein